MSEACKVVEIRMVDVVGVVVVRLLTIYSETGDEVVTNHFVWPVNLS